MSSTPVAADETLSVWIHNEIMTEVQRVQDLNSNVIPVEIRGTGLIMEEGKGKGKKKRAVFRNRIEVNTNFKFDRVANTMISERKRCDVKEGFDYVHVLFFVFDANGAVKQTPMLVPYVFPRNEKNSLEEWLIVNKDGQKYYHHVEF